MMKWEEKMKNRRETSMSIINNRIDEFQVLENNFKNWCDKICKNVN